MSARTGKRWRHGRDGHRSSGARLHYPPVITSRKAEISRRYLSEDERVRIGTWRGPGWGCGPSRRCWGAARRRSAGSCAVTGAGQRPVPAVRRAAAGRRRRARPGRGKLRLIRCWPVRGRPAGASGGARSRSAARCAASSRANPERHLAHETIYQAIYRPDLGGLDPGVCRRALRSGRRHRRRNRRAGARRPGVAGMIMISQRPAEAAARSVAGHWEGDLITGAANRSAIGTLVDRASRFTILVHLPGRRQTAEAVRDALVAALAALPAELRRSLTWDQGKEMALHADITRALGMPVFFCDPHAPWQRPDQREHQRAAPPVLPQGHRPAPARPGPPRRRRRRAQRPPPQDPRLGHPREPPRRPRQRQPPLAARQPPPPALAG